MIPRLSPTAYARVCVFALATLTIIIVTGAAVRLTGSGLGCPDWPTCANGQFVAASSIHSKIEFYNRVFTFVCSIAVAGAVLGSLLRKPRRKDLTWLSISLVVGVAMQAVLGGLSVIFRLSPPFVMGHFLLSMVLVFFAYLLVHRARQPEGRPQPAMSRDFILLVRGLAYFAFVVLFVGTLVTGSGPHGGDEDVERLGFSPQDITRVHSAFVWAFLALVVFTLWRMTKAGTSRTIIAKAEFLIITLVVQGAIGYFQYSLGVPAGLVIVHIVGAVAVWFAVLRLNFAMYERWEDHGLPAFDGEVNTSTLGDALIGPSQGPLR